MRLKGRDLQDTEDGIQKDVLRSQLERGNSPWGSWAFPVRAPGKKIRIVVNYQRVNSRTIRATYYLRRADDCKAEMLGSVYFSLLDAVSGFNHLLLTPFARQVLAGVIMSGVFLHRGLPFGPVNGPEAWQKLMHLLFRRQLFRRWSRIMVDSAARLRLWNREPGYQSWT